MAMTEEHLSQLQSAVSPLREGLELAIAECLNRVVQLGPLTASLDTVDAVQAEAASVFHARFSLPALSDDPLVLAIAREDAATLASLLLDPGSEPGDSPVLQPGHVEVLARFAEQLAERLAMLLGTARNTLVAPEAFAASSEPLALPPAFARSSHVAIVTLQIIAGLKQPIEMRLMATPDFAEALGAPAAPSQPASLDQIFDDHGTQADIQDGPRQPGVDLFPPLNGADAAVPRAMELILDVPLDVTVELGRVRMLIKDVLELSTGSIVELDRVAGEPVDLLVNGKLVAKGEVVVVDDNFGIRLTEIINPADRLQTVGGR